MGTPVVYGVLGLELAVVIVFAATYNALDFRIYMWGGHAVLDDSRLYLALAYGHWFTYSPFAAIVFVPVAALPLAVARVLWDLVSVAALGYSCTRILQIAGYRPTRIMVAGFVAAAMALDPVWETLFLGQINLILLALILTDIWLVSRGSSRLAVGVGVGIAAAIKLTPAIFIVFFLLARRTQGGLRRGRHVRLCGLIGFLVAPHASTLYWEHLSHDTRRVGAPYISNQSPYAAAIRIAGGQGHIGGWWVMVPLVFAVIGLAVAAILARRGGLAGRDRGHRGDRAAGLPDFLGAPLGLDPARPGPAGPRRAPDRRGAPATCCSRWPRSGSPRTRPGRASTGSTG